MSRRCDSATAYVIYAIAHEGKDCVITPFGHLSDGNPYDAYRPPDPDDLTGFLQST